MALTTVNTDGITDGTIKNIDVKSDAAIAGTKIAPDFGSQNIVTTGTLGSSDITLTKPGSAANAKLEIKQSGGGGGTSEILFSDAVSGRGRVFFDHGSNPEVLNLEAAGTIGLSVTTTGNVGIGTTDPQQLLHLSSTGTPRLRISDADGTNQHLDLFQAGGSTYLDTRNASSHGNIVFRSYDGTDALTRLKIATDGKVGIGTVNPGSLLELNAADDTAKLTFLRTGTTIGGSIQTRDESGDKGLTYIAKDGNSSVPNHVFQIDTGSGGVEKLRINSSGEIISNNGTLRRNVSDSSFTVSGDSASNTGANINLYGASHSGLANVFRVRVGASEKFRIDSNGDVGINTTSMTGKLNVQGSAGGVALETTDATNSTFRISHPSAAVTLLSGGSSQHLALGTGFAEKVRIDSSGRLLTGGATSSQGSTNADDLQIGANNQGNQTGITLGSASASSLRWADAANDSAAMINYVHTNGEMTIQANGEDNSTYGHINFKVAASDNSGSNNVITMSRGSTGATLAFPNGGGIDFYNYGTGTDIDSNLLDDYERGEFSPTISGSTTSGDNISYQHQVGTYVKVGNLVHITLTVSVTGIDNAAGNLRIHGLPFSQKYGYESVTPVQYNELGTGLPSGREGPAFAYMFGNSSIFSAVRVNDSGADGFSNLAVQTLSYMRINHTYITG